MLGWHLWNRQIAGQAAVKHYRSQSANGQLSRKNANVVKERVRIDRVGTRPTRHRQVQAT
jgi:hypothetical protein